ncbi:MAG: FAD-dependent oxidoreductase [Clostridiales bacterium]|nr:FAD-dependent oxidoreductase [Clostridiales bacterium]
MKYIIVGASAAGLSVAETIRKYDKKGKITIFTKENYLPYSRPSISYYLKGRVEEKDIFLRKEAFYRANNIEIITGAQVEKIDCKKKEIFTENGSYRYDRLCLATGSKPFTPPVKNVSGNKNVLTFLDLATVKQVKNLAHKDARAVIIGAGLIGMKAAEGLTKVCKSVDVVELSPRVLPSILDEKSAVAVKAYLEKNAISFHLENTAVQANIENGLVKSVMLKNGDVLPCDLLIMAVGVRPETQLAENAGLEVNRGIITNPETMQTSDPDIYAAGDCTVSLDMLDGAKKIIALWPNAVQQGAAAGAQMAGVQNFTGGTYSVNAIDFYSLRICTCGLINAKGEQYRDEVKQSGSLEDNSFSYKRLIFEGDFLVGYVLINSSANAGIYTSLISNKIPLSSLCGDIMEEPSLFMFDKKTRTQKLRGGVEI